MLKKTILTLAAVGLLAGAASAANYDINIYGASAQYTFWSKAAPTWLAAQGCVEYTGTTPPANVIKQASGLKNYIAQCNNGTDTITIRVGEAKSSEGVNSVQGILTPGSSNSCSSNAERSMAGVANLTNTDSTLAEVTALSCQDVTVGASDVAAGTFNQETIGDDNWKASGLNPYAWDFETEGLAYLKSAKNISIDSGYVFSRPVIVPFSFFVNADDTAGSAKEVPFSNLSRAEVINLVAGKVLNWNQLRPDLNNNGTANEAADYPGGDSLPVVLCLRHAGSGTLATLDAAIMRGDASMASVQAMLGDENNYDNGYAPETYFNTSSSDLMKCVGNNPGAFGYADTDKITALTELTPVVYNDGKYGDVKKVQYNGYYSNRESIFNGNYEFWAAQWLYVAPSEDAALKAKIQALSDFAGSPAGLVAAQKNTWWVGQDEMKVNKADDFKMPMF